MDETRRDEPTTVTDASPGALAFVWGGFPLLGALAGWLVKLAAGWIADLPWAPFQGPFELLNDITGTEPQSTIGALAIGAVAGLVVALLAHADFLTVNVYHDRVELKRDEDRKEFRRSSAKHVFVDDKRLVLVGSQDEELAREKTDLKAEQLEKGQ